jgi:hypothetical protein
VSKRQAALNNITLACAVALAVTVIIAALLDGAGG